jgi:molybdate transport system ATP-binding protein
LSERAAYLNVAIKHMQGALALDMAFELGEPWTVLFGPSGSGKTTVLRAIAGLVQPDTGRIVSQARLGGTEVFLDTEAKIFVPAYRRAVRFSAQSAALFPQMTVQENIAYGATSRNDGTSAASVVEEALDLFGLRPMATKRPGALSGGERQRVAVVRAVTAAVCLGPGTLVLLDEPFTGLDLRLRDELLGRLQPWLVRMELPVLSVTHDVGEAFQLGAEVIKIADGSLVQQGPVAEVLAAERRSLMEQLRAGSSALEA